MKLKRTTPCHDCAFRTNSRPGWTGTATVTEFVANVLDSDGDEPCHVAVNYDNPDWRDTLDEAPFCAGGLIFVRNNFKLPRDPERAEIVAAVDRSTKVFRSPAEFLTHHLQREVTNREAGDLIGAARNNRALNDDEPDANADAV